jgi:Fuc2NAc and GlcNAc transferase
VIGLIVLSTFLGTIWTCAVYHTLGKRWQIYDIPNSRSAHREAVVRGGGLGLLLGLLAGFILVLVLVKAWPAPYPQLLVAACGLALLGFIDDVRGLPVALRLCLYALLSLGTIVMIEPQWSWIGQGVAAFFVLWLLNLFNFMDGIDGLAATEAVFTAGSAGVLSLFLGGSEAFGWFCLLVAAASGGFLFWNRPPARLFMGDAGSVSLGFLLAMLALRSDGIPLASWLILLGVFIIDATYTLLWRIRQGHRFTQAHSLHLYQRLARHWDNHATVVGAVIAINTLWLLPLATAAALWPQKALVWVIVAWLPLLVMMAKAGKFP